MLVMLMKLVVLFAAAFAPPLLYTMWIRNTERYQPEPWPAVFICFAWGASIAIIASLILETILEIPFSIALGSLPVVSFIMAVIIAPFAEELTKPMGLGLRRVRREIDELEDGLVYGAAAGLGFSATENLFYGASFMSEGVVLFIVLIAVRTVGACLLHASATALTGYGFGRILIEKKHPFVVLPYLILAMGAHASYNFVLSVGFFGALGSLVLAVSLSLFLIWFVRHKIRMLDRVVVSDLNQ